MPVSANISVRRVAIVSDDYTKMKYTDSKIGQKDKRFYIFIYLFIHRTSIQ